MLDLIDAERDLLISDIKELLSWQLPKGITAQINKTVSYTKIC